ncbi:aftiphilin-like isoform X1 [Haemaphysalis longicornis]
MADLFEAVPDGGATQAVAGALKKIDAGTFNHEHFDDEDEDEFGNFAAAVTVPPPVTTTTSSDTNHIPVTLPAAPCATAWSDDASQDSVQSGQSANAPPTALEQDGDCGRLPEREDSFDDFQQAMVVPSFEPALETVPDDEYTDFADFEQHAGRDECVVVRGSGCEEGDSGGGEFADFAAFGDAPAMTTTVVSEGGEDDWADDGWEAFTGAENSAASGPVAPCKPDAAPGQQQQQQQQQQPCGEVGSFEVLLRSAYALESDPSSLLADDAEEFVALACCEAHLRLWEELQDLDRAPSLKFSWNGSLSCQHLLQSLSIDSRNILRNPSVPLFASHLGLLEPQRGGGGASPSHSASAEDEPAASAPPSTEAGADSLIPPAQFDWTSSGLVNPLEQPAASTLLDLEFLSSLASSTATPVGRSPPTSSLEKEFLELGNGSATMAAPTPSAPSKLQELLRNNVSTLSSTRRRPSMLSSEAQSILDRLPDLSFMQARVLMFPVHLD